MTSFARTDLRCGIVVVLRTCDRSIRIASSILPNSPTSEVLRNSRHLFRSGPGLILRHSWTCILIVYVPRSAGSLAIGRFWAFWLILSFLYRVSQGWYISWYIPRCTGVFWIQDVSSTSTICLERWLRDHVFSRLSSSHMRTFWVQSVSFSLAARSDCYLILGLIYFCCLEASIRLYAYLLNPGYLLHQQCARTCVCAIRYVGSVA